MNEVCQQAEEFLNAIFQSAGFALHATTEALDAQNCVLDIDGADASLLLSESGEFLEALQHLLNQTYGRKLPQSARIICDVQNFRATREAELRAMARHAAERVRATGVPFTFAPMNANERRVIHLSLAEAEDLFTESIGEGASRRIKVSFTPPTK
jgi:spoIIIJ-associated protein